MSIREIEKNKRYQIEIPLGYRGDQKIRHYETFHGTKKEARMKELQSQKELNQIFNVIVLKKLINYLKC